MQIVGELRPIVGALLEKSGYERPAELVETYVGYPYESGRPRVYEDDYVEEYQRPTDYEIPYYDAVAANKYWDSLIPDYDPAYDSVNSAAYRQALYDITNGDAAYDDAAYGDAAHDDAAHDDAFKQRQYDPSYFDGNDGRVMSAPAGDDGDKYVDTFEQYAAKRAPRN